MDRVLESHFEHFATLAAEARNAAQSLAATARQLAQGDVASIDLLIDLLQRTEAGYSTLSQAVRQEYQQADLSWCPPIPPNLDDLQSAIEALSQELTDRARYSTLRKESSRILARAARIQFSVPTNSPELGAFLATVRRLNEDLATRNEENLRVATSLVTGEHPIRQFVDLLDENVNQTDDEWNAAVENVRTSLGDSLGIAVMRGRLKIGAETAEWVRTIEQSCTQGEDSDVDVDKGIITGGAGNLLPNRSTIGFNANPTETTSAENSGSCETHTLEKSQRASDSDIHVTAKSADVTSVDPRSLKSLVATEATRNLAQLATIDESQIPNLVASLVEDGRYSLATQLCLEKSLIAPEATKLLRAVSLAEYVTDPDGDIARTLNAILPPAADHNRESESSRTPEKIQLTLLRTAAILRPGLVCPSREISNHFASLPMLKGLSQLYNLSHRIARFCDSGRGLNIRLFRDHRTLEDWQADFEDYRQAVQNWRDSQKHSPIRYTPAKHCFLRSHWSLTALPRTQQRHARVWQKLQSQINDYEATLDLTLQFDTSSSALARIRKVEQRLSEQLECRGGPAEARKITDDDLYHGYEQRVRSFLQRWLSLLETHPQHWGTHVPYSAEDVTERTRVQQLQQEIESRSAAVDDELARFAEQADALTKACVLLCRRSVAQVYGIFRGESFVARNEPNVQGLLHGELLRLPGYVPSSLTIVDGHSATTKESDREFREQIVDLLAGESVGQPVDWESALDRHLEDQTFVTAGRLLELDIWRDSRDREAAETRWTQAIAGANADVIRQVSEIEELLRDASACQFLSAELAEKIPVELQNCLSLVRARLNYREVHEKLARLRDHIAHSRTQDLMQIQQQLNMLVEPQAEKEETLFPGLSAAIAREATENDEGWIW